MLKSKRNFFSGKLYLFLNFIVLVMQVAIISKLLLVFFYLNIDKNIRYRNIKIKWHYLLRVYI